MIIDGKTATGLRNLNVRDSIQINGQKYEVEFIEELPVPSPGGERETVDGGLRMDLKNSEGISSFSLVLTDMGISYSLERVLAGPPPMNSNPDILFVQDMDAGKTYKYRISRRPYENIRLALFEGETGVEINSIQL